MRICHSARMLQRRGTTNKPLLDALTATGHRPPGGYGGVIATEGVARERQVAVTQWRASHLSIHRTDLNDVRCHARAQKLIKLTFEQLRIYCSFATYAPLKLQRKWKSSEQEKKAM
jgi:hypothetical protein